MLSLTLFFTFRLLCLTRDSMIMHICWPQNTVFLMQWFVFGWAGLFLVGLWQQMGCLPVQLIGFGCTHVANDLFTSIWVCICPYTQEVQVKSVMFMGFAHIYTWVMWHIYKEMYVQDGSWYVDMGCCMLVCMSQCSLEGRLVWSHAWLNASICGSMQNLYCKSQMLFVALWFLINK